MSRLLRLTAKLRKVWFSEASALANAAMPGSDAVKNGANGERSLSRAKTLRLRLGFDDTVTNWATSIEMLCRSSDKQML